MLSVIVANGLGIGIEFVQTKKQDTFNSANMVQTNDSSSEENILCFIQKVHRCVDC